MNSKGEKLRCHPLLAEITADAPELKDISSVMHGFQPATPCCRRMYKRMNMNDRTQYSSRSVQQVLRGRETVAKAEKNLKLAIVKIHSDKIRDLKEEIHNILWKISMSARQ